MDPKVLELLLSEAREWVDGWGAYVPTLGPEDVVERVLGACTQVRDRGAYRAVLLEEVDRYLALERAALRAAA